MALSCDHMELLITRLIDDGLGEDEKKQTLQHLQTCSACARMFEMQNTVKNRLKNTLARDKAPVHLRARIRRDIREYLSAPGFWTSLAEVFSTHKVKGFAAACALVLLFAVPYGQMYLQNSRSQDSLHMRPVSVQGKVLCIDCEVIEAAGYNPVCAEDHHLGIEDSTGKIWGFANVAEGKKIIHEFSLVNQRLEVEGYALHGVSQQSIKVEKNRKL